MKKPSKSQKNLAAFPGRLVLLGAGKMGGAMLDGWTARGLKARQVVVIDPLAGKPIKALTKRGLVLNPKPGPKTKADAAAIIIAVKPQMASEAIPPLGLYVGKSTLVVSIMAGFPWDVGVGMA